MSDSSHINMGEILCYKTNQLLAFNKPTGLAVQSKNPENLYYFANAYAKRPLHLIHRIDQPVSGIVLFGRNARAAASLSAQFASGKIQRKYLAWVDEKPVETSAVLSHHLIHHKKSNKGVLATPSESGAKECTLEYRYITSSDSYHLLEIQLHSGRHHQIRAQLAAAGLHIKGDVKYGARRANKDRSIHLHAAEMAFSHPVTGLEVVIKAPCPDDVLWNAYIG